MALSGGPLLTRADVAFLSGNLGYYARGSNVPGSRQQWESHLPAGGQVKPMSYLGENGRQYGLAVAGGRG